MTDVEDFAGVGLRIPHHDYFSSRLPAIGWLEVHSENYFFNQRLRHELLALAQHYPISLHGTGLSLGSTDPLNQRHLAALRELVDELEPRFVSEHLSWSSVDGYFYNDLLPLPYTEECLRHFADRIDAVQQYLGGAILIENPSSYLQSASSTLSEWAFFAQLPELTGCGLLLDLNNIYVSSLNHGFDPQDYLAALPFEAVREIHLAGFEQRPLADGEIYIDTHSRPVAEPVWQLYSQVICEYGPRPTLIEWDADLPSPEVLLAEADKAQAILRGLKAGSQVL